MRGCCLLIEKPGLSRPLAKGFVVNVRRGLAGPYLCPSRVGTKDLGLADLAGIGSPGSGP